MGDYDSSLLRSLFDEPVVALECDPDQVGPRAVVYEAERLAVARAVPKRQQEYFAVRHIARLGFAQLGVAQGPLLNAQDRSPVWPTPLVGSLSHTAGWCGVVMSRRNAPYVSLGIDAERGGKLSQGVAERVLTQRELQRLCGEAQPDVLDGATLLFSAKESVYKCIHPIVQRFVGFLEVEIDVKWERLQFGVTPMASELAAHPLWRQGTMTGRFARQGDLWVTAVGLKWSHEHEE